MPSDKDASYVIGLGLMQALAHAAPDVPPEKYAALGERYRHHYQAHHDDLSLFDGVLPMLDALKAQRPFAGRCYRQVAPRVWMRPCKSVELRGMFHGSRTADETAGKPNRADASWN